MAKLLPYVGIICILCNGYFASADSPKCDDIDTSACVLLIQQRPDLCSNEILAGTACKRFCKLCPVECYHCNATVQDYHECNNTVLCQQGEVCMRKELQSFVDGHHEYQMTCELKELCDGGTDVSFPFGKRDIQSRDLSIHCCTHDLCNYPEVPTTSTAPTTTTMSVNGCKRDIIILVDESGNMASSENTLLSFIRNLVSNFKIGTDASLVSMATFASSATTHWDLDRYTNIYDLTHAISTIHFKGGHGDVNAALSYVVNHAMLSQNANRPNVPDVVIVITMDDARSSVQEMLLSNQLHQNVNDVITIGIGSDVGHAELGHIATDSGHVIQVRHAYDLLAYEQRLVSLVCHGSLIP